MAFKTLESTEIGIGKLRAVEVGVTSRCNFKCSYCGAYDLLEKRILTPAELFKALDRLPDLERVKLSGGEVLLAFDHCEKIVQYCTDRGIETQINTNGTVLDEGRFERLEAAGLGVLHFSLNHTDAESHARFYHVPEKMFGKIVAAISRSVASNSIDTVVETIMFNETSRRLGEVHRFAAELGVRKHEIQMEIPGIHEGYQNTLSKSEIAETIASLADARHPQSTIYFSCLSAYFRPGTEEWRQLQPILRSPGIVTASCIVAKGELHIHSNGDVMICELGCPEVIGNIFEHDIYELFTTSTRLQEFIQKKHIEHDFQCFRNCDTPGQPVPLRFLGRRF